MGGWNALRCVTDNTAKNSFLCTGVSNFDFQSKLALKYTQDLYAKAKLKLKKVTSR